MGSSTTLVVISGEPMTSDDQTHNADHSLSLQVDAICDRFEAAWISGSAPQIEDFLEPLPGGADNRLLLELVRLDLNHRLKQGEFPTLEEYAKRFPDQAALLRGSLVGPLQTKFSEHDATLPAATLLEPQAKTAAKPPERSSSRQIGPYKLLQKLGEGGMGTVYMADQLEPLRRRVALKLIKSGMDSKQVVARFEAERQALAMMDHQNIAKVLDAGITEDGTPYFAMELVQGMPITKYCDREKLSIPDRLKLFVQVCRALQHAHQKGVIHRDIKPSNVLVTQRDGVPVAKVIDFGLAKALESELRLTDKTLFTEVGQVCGTLEYMSPEQAEMNELGLDTRTDVYSLGVLLYELLTGSTPLGQDRIRKEAFHRVLQLILTEEAPRPSRRLSNSGEAITGISDQRRIEPRRLSGILKRELDWIALKALEKDRNRRYDGAGSLANDVQNYLDGDVVTARPPSTGYRLRKAIRKHKAGFVSGTVFLLLLVAGLIGTGTMWLRASKAEIQATGEAKNAREAEAAALAAEAKSEVEKESAQQNLIAAEKTLYNANMLLAERNWEEKNIGDLKQVIEHYKSRDDLKGFEWAYWNRRVHSELLTLHGCTQSVDSVDFSPDGKRIVSGGGLFHSQDPGEVKIWDAESGKELLNLEGELAQIWSVDFSPDGKRVVGSGGDSSVQVWDANDGKELLTLSGHTGPVWSVGYSPDNTRIVSGGQDQTVRVWDAVTGLELFKIQAHPEVVRSVSFSPDGKRIVSGSDARTVKVWDAVTGQQTLEIEGHQRGVVSVSFSADSRQIVSGGQDHTLSVWDAATAQEKLTMTGHTGAVWGVRFSPNGKRIASVSKDKTVKLWDAETGKEIITFIGHTNLIHGLSFSPDGQRIASGSRDNTVIVWDAEAVQDTLTLVGHEGSVQSVSFSADGKRIVSGSSDKTVKAWDAESGLEALTLNECAEGVEFVGFSPDGTRVVGGGGDKTVRVWNAKTGQETLTLNGHSDWVSCVCVSPNGKRIASASADKTIRLWDADTGQQILALRGHLDKVYTVSFSPNGKQLVSGSADKTAKVWDVQTGRELLTLCGHLKEIASVGYSLDGTRIVTGSGDEALKVWNAETGQEMLTFNGHSDRVKSASFSPDGKRIVSGSDDKMIKLWDAETAQETLTLKEHKSSVRSVCFSPDGERIISGSADGTLKLWDARPWFTEQRVARQAGTVVRAAWQQEFTKDTASELIRSDQTITEPVREKALQLVEVMSGPTATVLNEASWSAVRKSDSTRTEYEKALRQIQAVVESKPDEGFYLNTLGVAQYRVGDYHSALTTLTRSEQMNNTASAGSLAFDLVFLAMTNQQLGNTDRASEQLQQVRQLSQEPRWSSNTELRGFLQEAEALIESDPPPETNATDPATPPEPATPSDPPPNAAPEAK